MLTLTPPMGFNTWNTFGGSFNDFVIREIADAFIENGLLEAGYNYLVLDDCWQEKQRDSVTGKIIADKKRFPDGIKATGDYIHGKGLKFGLYACAGVRTCIDNPGSFDHEYFDAATFAEYGCDFLKYDFCYKPESANGPLMYYRMGMALKSCGREILFSTCNFGADDVSRWIRSTGAHMYRSTGDIFDNFISFKGNALSQLDNLGFSAPGCYNDIDMMTVGMYGKGNVGTAGCDDTDYKTQFALWCMLGSPLMLGCDIRNMTEATKKLVTNKELIKINQDTEARPSFSCGLIRKDDDKKALVKHLSNGEYAIGFFNLSENEDNVFLLLEEMGIPAATGYCLELTDVFTGENIGVQKECIKQYLRKHDCSVYRAKLTR